MEKSQRTKTNTKVRLALRLLVALYILYLTEKIIESSVRSTSSLPLWVTVIVSIVFLTGSIAFGIYAWRDYRKSSAALASESAVVCPQENDANISPGISRK